MKRAKGKTKLATKSRLTEDILDPKNHKVRITTWIDGDLLQHLKMKAEAEGTRYQSLLNKLLRDLLINQESDVQARLAAIEKRLKMA